MATSGTTTSGTTTSATTADTSFCSSVYTTDYSGTHSCLRQDGTFASCWNGYESVGSPAFCKSSDAGPATAPTPPTTAATSFCSSVYTTDYSGTHSCLRQDGTFASCWNGYESVGSPAFCKSSDAGPATAPTPPTTAATSHCPTAYYADTLGNHTCTTSTGSFAQC